MEIPANGGNVNVALQQTKKIEDVKVNDYDKLNHKPSINGVVLEGNKTSEELGIDEATWGNIQGTHTDSNLSNQINYIVY